MRRRFDPREHQKAVDARNSLAASTAESFLKVAMMRLAHVQHNASGNMATWLTQEYSPALVMITNLTLSINIKRLLHRTTRWETSTQQRQTSTRAMARQQRRQQPTAHWLSRQLFPQKPRSDIAHTAAAS